MRQYTFKLRCVHCCMLWYEVVLRGDILFNLVILAIQISMELSIFSYDSVFVYNLILILVYISECYFNFVCCCLIQLNSA